MSDIDSSGDRPRSFARRHPRLVAVVVVVLIGLGIAWTVHHSRSTQRAGNAFGDMPTTVATAVAIKGDLPVNLPALGTITPLATVTVKTQISGQLVQVAFKEGQMVRAGDFLAQIDPRPYQAALDQAQADLRRDQALLANAKVDLARYQGLIAEDSIAKQQLDTQQALVDQYEGTLAGDQAQIATAKLNLQYTHILSPVSGRLGLRQVDSGNYVTPGDTNGLVVVTQLEPITAIFSLPEDYTASITKKLREGVSLTVDAFDRTNAAKLADGKLLTVDNVIDTTTGTVKLRALFDNKDGALFANQFVNIELLEDVLRDQVIVPGGAVHRGSASGDVNTFVYLVDSAKRTVSVRPVKLGISDGERVVISSGLLPGDVVVTEGADRLRDGAKIALPGDEPAPAAPRPGQARAPAGRRNASRGATRR